VNGIAKRLGEEFLWDVGRSEKKAQDFETDVERCESGGIETAQGAVRCDAREGVGRTLAEADCFGDEIRYFEICGG
jgi:hypothetical protein